MEPLLNKETISNTEPATPITQAEKDFIKNTVNHMTREEVLKRLKRDVQTACEIELATIPIYLFAYYSIIRNEFSGENIRPIDLYANKAGSHIMSVAVEEMLHMSLSANLYFSLFGEAPQLYRKSPALYPTPLPYHNPLGPPGPEGETDAKVEIPLAKFSYEQLWHFLQIENPGHLDSEPKDRDWDTIGQFYSYIRCLIHSSKITDKDFTTGNAELQIQPSNYSPNNVDSVSPKSKFNTWKNPSEEGSAANKAEFANTANSHAGKTQLITVSSKQEALLAIDTICDQGEGFNHTKSDDPKEHELSHYYKFLSLQAQFEQYKNHVECLVTPPKPPAPITPTVTDADLSKIIVNFPDNPKTGDYPAEFLAISNFCNGLYQYMLIMTETIFYVPAESDRACEFQSQKMYFNIALHRSMIWVLDKFIQTMRKIKLPHGKMLAPTFEFVDLGEPKESFAKLVALGAAAIAASKGLEQGSDIEYYINIALTKTQNGKAMHLPDVADYRH